MPLPRAFIIFLHGGLELSWEIIEIYIAADCLNFLTGKTGNQKSVCDMYEASHLLLALTTRQGRIHINKRDSTSTFDNCGKTERKVGACSTSAWTCRCVSMGMHVCSIILLINALSSHYIVTAITIVTTLWKQHNMNF